jgi:hypothetical protein
MTRKEFIAQVGGGAAGLFFVACAAGCKKIPIQHLPLLKDPLMYILPLTFLPDLLLQTEDTLFKAE